MIQPSSSGSQRLTISPVYFTLLRFELLGQLRIVDARGRELLRLLRRRRRPAASACRGSSCSPIVTSAICAVLQQRLELAVGQRSAGRRRGSTSAPGRAAAASARPYHSERRRDARRCVGRARSPPRGLNRGDRIWSRHASDRHYALAPICSLFERQAVRAGVDDDRVAFAEVALEHPQRQRIEHPPLNGALERPRAVGRIVALRARAVPSPRR